METKFCMCRNTTERRIAFAADQTLLGYLVVFIVFNLRGKLCLENGGSACAVSEDIG